MLMVCLSQSTFTQRASNRTSAPLASAALQSNCHRCPRRIEWIDLPDEGSRLQYLDVRAWERPGQPGSCLLFHDSFGHDYYAKLLAEHFGRLVAVPSSHLDPRVIERERPTVVVLEIVERLFQGIGARRPSDPPRRSLTR